MLLVTARLAAEVDAVAVCRGDHTAFRAGSAGVGGYNPLHLHPRQYRLVRDELLELAESPGMQAPPTVLAVTLAADTDTGQVFRADGAHAADETPVHDLTADLVIQVMRTFEPTSICPLRVLGNLVKHLLSA